MSNSDTNLRQVDDPQLMEFIKFCKQKIGYRHKAKVIVSDDHAKAQEMRSMGAFFPDPEDPRIWILRGKRQRADWYRSLAHELVHHGQRERGDSLDGVDGSETENEANCLAGIILREWGRLHPEIFESGAGPITERLLAVTEEDIPVRIEIDTTTHADQRTEDRKISDDQIVAVSKLGMKQIGHDQLVGTDQAGQKYCIHDGMSDLNVVGTLLRQGGELVFLVITVMVHPEFKVGPDTKKITV